MEVDNIGSRPPASVVARLPRGGASDSGHTCDGIGPFASPGRITRLWLEPVTLRRAAPQSSAPSRRCTHRNLRSRATVLQLARCVLYSYQRIAPAVRDSPVSKC